MTRSLRFGRGPYWHPVALLGLALALTLPAARSASAQETAPQRDYTWALAPRGGYDFVEHELSVGVHGLIPFAQLGAVAKAAAYPNIDAFLFEDRTRVRFDLDLAFPFRLESLPVSPYVGLGFGIVYESVDFRENTLFDFNLLAGVALVTGTLVEPFVETEASLFGTDTVGLYFGVNIYPTFRRNRTAAEQENPAALPQEEDF